MNNYHRKRKKNKNSQTKLYAKARHCELRDAMILAAIFNLPFCLCAFGVNSVNVVVSAFLLVFVAHN